MKHTSIILSLSQKLCNVHIFQVKSFLLCLFLKLSCVHQLSHLSISKTWSHGILSGVPNFTALFRWESSTPPLVITRHVVGALSFIYWTFSSNSARSIDLQTTQCMVITAEGRWLAVAPRFTSQHTAILEEGCHQNESNHVFRSYRVRNCFIPTFDYVH